MACTRRDLFNAINELNVEKVRDMLCGKERVRVQHWLSSWLDMHRRRARRNGVDKLDNPLFLALYPYNGPLNPFRDSDDHPEPRRSIVLVEREKQIAMVRLLLQNKADPNAIRPTDGKRPLHIANQLCFAQMLVKAKADVNAQCKTHGYTPLMLADCHFRMPIIDYLLENKADVMLETHDGKNNVLFHANVCWLRPGDQHTLIYVKMWHIYANALYDGAGLALFLTPDVCGIVLSFLVGSKRRNLFPDAFLSEERKAWQKKDIHV